MIDILEDQEIEPDWSLRNRPDVIRTDCYRVKIWKEQAMIQFGEIVIWTRWPQPLTKKEIEFKIVDLVIKNIGLEKMFRMIEEEGIRKGEVKIKKEIRTLLGIKNQIII